jgi:hypothetical protein
MRKSLLVLLVVLAVTMTGCGTMGSFRANNTTNIELSEANFNIVARDVQGSATQGYLLGVSYPQISDVATFGLIKVSGVEKLYDAAVKALWDDYREKYGSTEGRNLLLINVRQDSETLNTFFYTEATLFITADVVEFVE